MAEDKKTGKTPHNLVLENRTNLSVSGVSDMDSFDEQMIVLYTDMGELTVKGIDLHIKKLSLETGEVEVTGDIHNLDYTESRPTGKSFFSRLFR